MLNQKIVTSLLILLSAYSTYAQVGVYYQNYEIGSYDPAMKSDDFTYLLWDRNHNGEGLFSTDNRPMFFYWDNDDNVLGYLIDTRNMSNLYAKFRSLEIIDDVEVSGKLGIGTSTPSEELDVVGTIKGDWLKLENRLVLKSSVAIAPSNGTQKMYLHYAQNSSSENLAFTMKGNDATDRMSFMTDYGSTGQFKERLSIIAENGNVGIGHTAPTEKLEVNGTIRSKEVKVEATPWPDYVFSPEYKLASLKETETFIAENGHLSNIPGAEEVKENGLLLGEMNAKLLEKIEELTLHLIAQNKEIEALKEKLEVVESKLRD